MLEYLLTEPNTGLMNAITAREVISFFPLLYTYGKVICNKLRPSPYCDKAEKRGFKVYYPYIRKDDSDGLNHCIEALSLAIDTGACTYLEYDYLVDILKVASRIRWMH